MRRYIKLYAFIFSIVFCLSGCISGTNGKRIVRIAHSQSETHPDHIGLMAFEKYVEDRLGDKYDVQIYPNELLGSSVKTIELTQTGAIDFVVCSTGNLETPNSKGKTYKLSREIVNEFLDKNSSVVCKELKGVTTGKVLRPCADCIKDAAKIAEEVLFSDK